MVTTKVIEICTCDRCKKEIDADRWTIKMNRLNINREFDLCEDCEYEFKAFMMNKIHYEKPKCDLEEKVIFEETEGVVEPVVEVKIKDEGNYTSTEDIDFKRGLPDKLKKIMADNNIKRAELAELIGISPASLYRWLSDNQDGVNRRTRDKLEKFINEYKL